MAGYREFVTGEVLTAANVNGFLMEQSVMTFADDAARDAALTAVLREGMLAYNLDTKALEVYDGTDWGPVVTAKEKRIEAFTGSGNWTVPAGVTYAIATILGGGASNVGRSSTSTGVLGVDGGNSSVDFPGGLVVGLGGKANKNASNGVVGAANNQSGTDAPANSGLGGGGLGNTSQDMGFVLPNGAGSISHMNAVPIVYGGAVTPAGTVAVVVGAGGVGGGTSTKGGDGGSGYVYIEYYEEV